MTARSSSPRDRYIAQHAPTLLLMQAFQLPPAMPGEPAPKLDADRAIRAAGALYDRLAAAGHVPAADAPREERPRASVDYVSRLAPDSLNQFRAFYRAYWRGGKARGLQRAAMRWGQIDPDADLALCIIAAAEADAAAPRPADAVRAYPERWLAERRWEDHAAAAPEADPAAERAAELRELRAERNSLARLYAAQADETLARQLADLDHRIAALKEGTP